MSEKAEKDTLKDASLTECEKQNAGFYDDIKAENYGKSYGNPTYSVEKLGEEYGTFYLHCMQSVVNVLRMPMLGKKNERDDHGRIIC